MAAWPVQEAKSRFSELLSQAEQEGPQIITRHGDERAVVLSIGEYRKLTAPKSVFKELILGGPKFEEFEISRDKSVSREIEL